MSDMTSNNINAIGLPDAISDIIFDAMFGIKKLTNLIYAVTCPILANKSSVFVAQIHVIDTGLEGYTLITPCMALKHNTI